MHALAKIVAICLALTATARAADGVIAAQEVVRAQEQALGRDDDATAYGLAAPGIQALFDLDEFKAMVRSRYAPVYRHKSFDLGEAKQTEAGKIVQRVHILDDNGVAWEALYTIEAQSDGAWKISGCVLLKADQSV